MAYNEFIADRIHENLKSRHVSYEEKKMFGGICFMVNDKMCLGVIKDDLMARIDPEKEQALLAQPGARPMDFTTRPMKGYLYVDASGIDSDQQLDYWVDECLSFNPKAKSSKRRKDK